MKRHRRPSLPRLLLGCWIGLLLAAAPATGALAAPDAEVHGTGFGVARGPQGTVILTAFHVVRDALQGRRTITIGAGAGGSGAPIAWHPATLLASDEASDLALLSTTASYQCRRRTDSATDSGRGSASGAR
jgi:S1-C subfamily serine protease